MVLGRVVANVVSTVKDSTYLGLKILMIQPVNENNKYCGEEIIAIDKVQAGVGDLVLVMTEGNSARQMLSCNTIPTNMVVVGIVDHVESYG